MSPKRILIFSFVYYPRFIGGAEIAIKEITDRISPDDIEFHMVTLRLDKNLPKEEKIGNVHVFRIGLAGNIKDPSDSLRFPYHYVKYFYPFTGFLKARSLHRKYRYDATWSMMANYSGFAALLFKYWFPKIPFILTLQEGDPIEYIKKRVGIFYSLFEKIFTKADKIQTISHYLADWARDMGHTREVVVVPNGVDLELFDQEFEESDLASLKEEMGKRPGDIFIVTTSRLVVKNAVDDVVKALSYLPENVKFLILGQGYEEENIRKIIKDLRLGERIKMLGYVPHKEMPKYLKISDIFIRPSVSEGFGNSFIEAMAAGLPVLATPVGGIVDFLEDEKTGLFVEVKNPESIARQVSRLIEDKKLNDDLIRNAKKMVLERYGWGLISSEMHSRVLK